MVDGVKTCRGCKAPVSEIGCEMEVQHVESTGDDGDISVEAGVERAQSASKRPRIL